MTPQPLRLAKRYLGFFRQCLADFPMHRDFAHRGFGQLGSNVREQARLLRYSSISAEDYFNLGLYDASMPFEVKRSFLGSFDKWRVFDSMTPAVYDILARDKAIFHLLADALGIRTPVTLATTAPGAKPGFALHLQTADAVREFLDDLGAGDLFFKPVDGSLGEGAFALGRFDAASRRWEELPGKQLIDADGIIKRLLMNGRLGRFLIQRRLIPHPETARIVPDVCLTVRLMTLMVDNDPVILGAALRIGSGRSATDNIAGGGLAAPIDPASGRIERIISLDKGVPEDVHTHPVTGKPIELAVIPDWDDVKTLALESARKVNFVRCIAWDIGLTNEGPIVIEINNRPKCISIQVGRARGLLDGPLAAELAQRNGLLDCGLIISTHPPRSRRLPAQ